MKLEALSAKFSVSESVDQIVVRDGSSVLYIGQVSTPLTQQIEDAYDQLIGNDVNPEDVVDEFRVAQEPPLVHYTDDSKAFNEGYSLGYRHGVTGAAPIIKLSDEDEAKLDDEFDNEDNEDNEGDEIEETEVKEVDLTDPDAFELPESDK
jgi:hypothetical protein